MHVQPILSAQQVALKGASHTLQLHASYTLHYIYIVGWKSMHASYVEATAGRFARAEFPIDCAVILINKSSADSCLVEYLHTIPCCLTCYYTIFAAYR